MVGQHVSGRCLCGAVTFEAQAFAAEMGACHCGQCRRWTGGLLFYVSVEPKTLTIGGADHLGVYGSSALGERCFCRTCGSSLIWRRRDGSAVDVSAQALDDASRFPFTVEVHLADKPGNYRFANQTRQYLHEADIAGEARDG